MNPRHMAARPCTRQPEPSSDLLRAIDAALQKAARQIERERRRIGLSGGDPEVLPLTATEQRLVEVMTGRRPLSELLNG